MNYNLQGRRGHTREELEDAQAFYSRETRRDLRHARIINWTIVVCTLASAVFFLRWALR